MAKVDWINWKTDPKDIIDPNRIETSIMEYYYNYNKQVIPLIYEPLKNEIEKGGLSKDAFQVLGESPANEMAVDIVNTIDEIRHTMNALMKLIRYDVEDQKQIEKKQLVQAIEDKIKAETMFLENVKNNTDTQNHFINKGENIDDIIDIVEDRIKILLERLETAKSL